MLATFSLHSHAPQSSVSLATPLHPSSSPASDIMPRLRHRMRCRRGSTCRQLRRSPSSSSASSTHSDSHTSPPRGIQLCSGRRINSPIPLSIPAQTHTARFSFDCSLNRPRVTASITVAFCEEPREAAPNSDFAGQSNTAALSSDMHPGSLPTVNVGLQGKESTATQTSERKDVQELSMEQEGLEHTREVLKDDGQASDEKKDKVQMSVQ